MAFAPVLGELVKKIGVLVEDILGNKVVKSLNFYDCASDSEIIKFELRDSEVFGKTLRVEYRHDNYPSDKPNIEKLVKTVLRQAIEKLPRHDRIERERLWKL